MRTTLTIDDDVAARIEQLRGSRTWKELVNHLLRVGLDRETGPPAPRVPYRITPVSTGPPKVDVSRIGELLALEDEGVRK